MKILFAFIALQLTDQELELALESYYKAINKDRFHQIESFSIEAEVTDAKQTFQVTIYRKRPMFFRQIIRTKSAEIVQIYDGNKAWGLDYAGRKRELGERQSNYVKSLAPIDPLLLSAEKSSMILSDASLKSGYWEIVISENEVKHTFWINRKTGLVDFSRREDKELNRKIDIEVKSYRNFDGFVYPAVIHQKIHEGAKSSTLIYEVKNLELHPDLPVDFF